MKILFLAIFAFCILNIPVKATHITGGEIVVTAVSPETYEIKVIIFRDCAEFVGFDDPLYISFFNAATNVYIDNLEISDPVIDTFPISFACFDTIEDLCFEKATYTAIVELPTLIDGYYVVYQRCCREDDILNFEATDEDGMTLFQTIPGLDFIENSSPEFNYNPEYFICLGDEISLNYGASDPDGDSLFYEFYLPYTAMDPFDPAPEIASPPPYIQTSFQAGYSPDNLLDADPAITLDAATGIISGMPTLAGKFIIPLSVKEYRDGELIGVHYRECIFIVENCALYIDAITPASIEQCENKTVEFENHSMGAADFYWEFGDGDASVDFEPVHEYDDYGNYEVMLIAKPGSVCADTAYVTINLLENTIDSTITFDGTTLHAEPGHNYQWYLNGLIIGGATSADYTPTADGDYYVMIVNDICGDGASNIISVSLVEIENHVKNIFNIYPNPSNGDITIRSPYTQEIGFYRIYNPVGQKIMEENLIFGESQHLMLRLQSGIYHIEFITEDISEIRTMVIN